MSLHYLHVIHLHVSIVSSGEQQLGVWGESNGTDGHGMTLQGVHQLAALHVKYVDEPVDGTAGNVLPITTLVGMEAALLS